MALISCAGITVAFGGEPLFTDVSFQVEPGERWGVIGRNGTGKTTLMQVLMGARPPEKGTVSRTAGIRIAVMDQYRELGGASTVWEAAARGFASLFALEHEIGRQATAIGEAGDHATPAMLDRYSHDLERFEHDGGYTATARVDAVLAGLGFDPEVARTREVETLSGGERGRLALAGQLAAPADLLILDEPTNHLDIATARWLEAYLREINEAVLLISHDRAFLDVVADHVLHFEGGTANAYEGNYARFVTQRAERRLALERAVKKENAKVAAEEDFIRRNIAGQKTKQAQGRRRRLERMPRLSAPPGTDGTMAVTFSTGDRGGDQVLVAEKLALRIGDRQLLKPWSTILRREDVVGLIGSNGAGKSTLLKTLVGERVPDGGEIRIMPSMRLAYYRQDLSDVDPDITLYDLISHQRGSWNRGQIQGHLGRFGFSGSEVQRKAGSLSGGERARVALALMMLIEANLLVFDEPTNHLDVESIEVLEDAVEEYEGTVILVTHDRALLTALTTRIWSFEDGVLEDFPGGYTEWEATVAARRAAKQQQRKLEAQAPRAEGKKSKSQSPEPKAKDEAGKRQRAAERTLAAAEVEVARREKELAALEEALADPALYSRPDARETARKITASRDAARHALGAALGVWEAAGAAMEQA